MSDPATRGVFTILALLALSSSCGGGDGDVDGGADATVRRDGATGGDGSTGVDGSGARDGGEACSPDAVWSASSRFAVEDPRDHGAVGDGATDDSAALEAAVDALPDEGGIVRFAPGTYLKDHHLWYIRDDHVFLWAPEGGAAIHGTVRVQTPAERDDPTFCGPREQSTIFERTSGGGVFGLRFTSNATERLSCAETSQIVLDGVSGVEIVGVEFVGSSGGGIFAWHSDAAGEPSHDLHITGNYVHHTYADSIHHTRGTRRSWVWNNYIFNEEPSRGDDGVACVTYGVTAARCGDMEWWSNRYLGGVHGRGMAVVGGEDIAIHHNWIIESAGAGLIVASEGSYGTATVDRVELRSNWLVRSPNGTVSNGHSGILVSGGNSAAPPITEITSVDNVIIDPAGDRVERAEGSYDAATVTFDDSTDPADLPGPEPLLADAAPISTAILRTRDLASVPSSDQRGLHRIHVRAGPSGIEERFEYALRGPTDALRAFVDGVTATCGARVVEIRDGYALLVASTPLAVPDTLEGVTFEELRAGDRDGTLSWLWARIDAGDY